MTFPLKLIFCDVGKMGDDLALHESVFNGDIKQVSKLLRTYDATKKDKHGMFICIIVSSVWKPIFSRYLPLFFSVAPCLHF